MTQYQKCHSITYAARSIFAKPSQHRVQFTSIECYPIVVQYITITGVEA